MLQPKPLARTLLLAVVLLWGATFVLVKDALRHCTPLLFNLLRMALATVALLLVNRNQLRTITRSQLAAGSLAGLFLAAGYQFQTLGLTSTTPAKSAFLTGLNIVFVPALTLFPFLRPAGLRRPGLSAAVAALLAFTGLILLTTPSGTEFRNLCRSIGIGDLLTIVAAFAFTLHLLTLARISRGVAPGLLATLQLGFCTAFMLVTLPFERPHILFTFSLILTFLVCGLLGTAAAFTIQTFAQQVLPPTATVLLLTLEPVFGWLTSLLILHERFGVRALTGAALIFCAILLVELAPASAHTVPA